MFAWLTDEFSRFVGPLVDKGLKGLFHGVDEAFAPREAHLCHVVHLVLEVQQVLHHVLVFLRGAYDLPTEGLRPEKGWPMSDTFVLALRVYGDWALFIPLCNLSRTEAKWGVLPSPCWRAGRGGRAQSLDSHPAGSSDLVPKYHTVIACAKLKTGGSQSSKQHRAWGY